MNHPALDAYLDELLDLTVDAVAPAPVAANAPVMAIADKAVLDSTDGEIADEAPLPLLRGGSSEAPAAGNMPMAIDAGLLTELDSDPLFAAQAPAEETPLPLLGGGSTEAAAAGNMPMAIDAGLLAELDSDPLFAAQAPGSDSGRAEDFTPPQPHGASTSDAAMAIDADLLAELDSDPLFAAAFASDDASTPNAPAIDPGLLAELDSDPLLAAALSATPTAPPPKPVASPKPTPAASRGVVPQVEPRSGLRPVEVTPPALPPSVTTTHRWLRVAVGEDSYAVELLRVQEVGRTVPIVAMRGAAPSVLGAMNLRGRIVPVFDLGLWLGTGRVEPDERARIVVVERDNELIGALVSAVDDVVTLGPDRIEPPLMASPSRAIVGVARVVAKPTVLLDANALFG